METASKDEIMREHGNKTPEQGKSSADQPPNNASKLVVLRCVKGKVPKASKSYGK